MQEDIMDSARRMDKLGLLLFRMPIDSFKLLDEQIALLPKCIYHTPPDPCPPPIVFDMTLGDQYDERNAATDQLMDQQSTHAD